jgi:hypothetical protein
MDNERGQPEPGIAGTDSSASSRLGMTVTLDLKSFASRRRAPIRSQTPGPRHEFLAHQTFAGFFRSAKSCNLVADTNA